MTFAQLYQKEIEKYCAARQFITEMAELTKKHPVTVRRWVSPTNDIYPDALTQQILADHFHTTPEELFPPKQ